MSIPIYKPFLKNYKKSAIECINSEWISNHGIYINLASEKLKKIFDIKYCILMNNGTSATQCLYKSIKFKYPNINKIYVPNNVFVAPWNCCLMEYDKSIIEVMKMDENTLNIDVSENYINSLEKNSAVCIVHNFGNIINVPRLKRLRPDLIFVEDNCEGIFGKYEGLYSGSDSLCSAVSFYGNKTITTGEGGAFFTNDEELYNYILNIYSHGMSKERYIHKNLGYNFRMTNIEAAFLYDQLNDIENILEIKRKIFEKYDNLLEPLLKDGKIYKTKEEKYTSKSNWMYNIIIPSILFKDFENYMTSNNIEIRPFFYDIHEHDHLKDIISPYSTDFNKNITKYGVILPSFPELTEEQQIYITNMIKLYIK